MKYIRNIAILLLLFWSATTTAQIRIPETNVSFSFPHSGWKYLQTNKVNENTTVYLYSYSKDYVIDGQGDTVIPFMRIYVRKNYNGTVYDMAYNRYMNQPFQSLDEHIHDNGSLEYLGAYANEEEKKDCEFRMLYLKDKSNLLEIRLETVIDRFDDFDEEFKTILKSIKTTNSSR